MAAQLAVDELVGDQHLDEQRIVQHHLPRALTEEPRPASSASSTFWNSLSMSMSSPSASCFRIGSPATDTAPTADAAIASCRILFVAVHQNVDRRPVHALAIAAHHRRLVPTAATAAFPRADATLDACALELASSSVIERSIVMSVMRIAPSRSLCSHRARPVRRASRRPCSSRRMQLRFQKKVAAIFSPHFADHDDALLPPLARTAC